MNVAVPLIIYTDANTDLRIRTAGNLLRNALQANNINIIHSNIKTDFTFSKIMKQADHGRSKLITSYIDYFLADKIELKNFYISKKVGNSDHHALEIELIKFPVLRRQAQRLFYRN